MANVSKILQTVGKGIKSAANSKAGKAVGKGLNTIFTPVKKAHQMQGCESIKAFFSCDPDNVSIGYMLGTLGAGVATLGTLIGELVTGISSDKHFENNREKYEKQALISSKLNDATIGLIGGFILGGPIGALLSGGIMAAIPKDIVNGKSEMWSRGKETFTYNDVRAKHLAARKEARAEQKIDKETLENIPKMTAGSSDFKPDTTDKKQTVDTLNTKADTVAIADTTKTKIDSVAIQDSTKVTVDTVAVADTTKKEEVKPLKTAAVDSKSEEVKSEEKTNFWNGELNEIEVESIQVDKGDCLWNIAKRELQKANEGKRITNAQIVKQVKEFGRLNPELFGDNPTYESLDFVREGATLKLSA